MQNLQSKDFCPSGSKRKGDIMKIYEVIRVSTGTIAIACTTRAEANKWIAERIKLAGHDSKMYRIEYIDI
ncbi:hypothetical protein [Rhodococcus erythropolis]|uniref:hypothetical protein n=1 Tax=Rhodococcus erythropolis TaxID=1833 RepID=UPI0020AEA9E3